MTTETSVAPNTPANIPLADGAAQQHNALPSLENIATKMTAMRNQMLAERNQSNGTSSNATGETDKPVAPQPVTNTEPEIDEYSDTTTAELNSDDEHQSDTQDDPVSTDQDSDSENSTAQDIIDFLEFTETNPQAKFKFKRNGQDIIIDAKKAAAILGQGSAIHEDARKLKIQKSEFDEYEKEQRSHLEGLSLAMEFTVQPKLQQAYDEIAKTQGYQNVFAQQLEQVQDAAQRARIQASMQQNERYIQLQAEQIRDLKPKVDQFQQIRRDQVKKILDDNRKAFTDRELKNEFVYNELRDKVSKNWAAAKNQLVPGIENIDLISSDEYLLGLIRDGLKFRDKPQQKNAGASIAVLQTRKGNNVQKSDDQKINELRQQAKGGDKKAADNLLVAQLSKLKAARSR